MNFINIDAEDGLRLFKMLQAEIDQELAKGNKQYGFYDIKIENGDYVVIAEVPDMGIKLHYLNTMVVRAEMVHF